MEITDLRFRKVEGDGKLKAYVSITFDDEFVVHNVKVIESDKGMFIGMPDRMTKSGKRKDIAHPINSQFREKIEKTVLEAFEKID